MKYAFLITAAIFGAYTGHIGYAIPDKEAWILVGLFHLHSGLVAIWWNS